MKYIKTYESMWDDVDYEPSTPLEKAFLENGISLETLEVMYDGNYFNTVKYINDGIIKVFRNITILDDDIPKLEDDFFGGNIGKYWSLSSGTHAIWGDREDGLDDRRLEYQCVGYLNLGNINWEIMLSLINSEGDDFAYLIEEKEIRGNVKIKECYRI